MPNLTLTDARVRALRAHPSTTDIDRQAVERWFASLRATPVSADRSMPVLSVILTEAERMGHRPEGSNPCRGIRRYRRKGRERFLSDVEIRRLSETLSAHEGEKPLQVAAVRMILLTGCRKSEVLTLLWSDYREGRLFLRDSKSGPRTVWLSRAARHVLDAVERRGAWVFPAPRGSGPAGPMWLRYFWHRVRVEADLPDVRLHDLRHAHATFARNPRPSLGRGARRHPRPRRFEDRAAQGAAQCEGSGCPRATAPGRESLRLPLPARRGPSADLRPHALGHGALRGRPRGSGSVAGARAGCAPAGAGGAGLAGV